MSDSVEMVALKRGFVISIDALRLGWALEDRGCVVREDEGGTLFVGPQERLTSTDLDHIRQHRDDLIALVRYCEAVQ